MSVTDFLFNGSPPSSVTTYGESITNTPKWYTDYTLGIASKANAIAAAPYQAYTSPRVAGFTPQQKAAFEMTNQAATAYQPYFQNAMDYSNAAGSTTGLAAANPYFAQASKTLPQGVGDYMNPYQDAVVNRIGDLAKRQLSENIIPTIQNQFIGGGSFGGSRSGEALSRGMRDLQESTMAQQSQALQQGYSQAAQQFAADQTRLAQMGQSAGTLQAADLNRMLELSKNQETMGGLAQQYGLTGAAAEEAVGQQQQGLAQRSLDLAYNDFMNQKNDPYNKIAFLNAAVRGLNIPTMTTTDQTGPANVYQPSVLAQLASAGMTGAAMKKAGLI